MDEPCSSVMRCTHAALSCAAHTSPSYALHTRCPVIRCTHAPLSCAAHTRLSHGLYTPSSSHGLHTRSSVMRCTHAPLSCAAHTLLCHALHTRSSVMRCTRQAPVMRCTRRSVMRCTRQAPVMRCTRQVPVMRCTRQAPVFRWRVSRFRANFLPVVASVPPPPYFPHCSPVTMGGGVTRPDDVGEGYPTVGVRHTPWWGWGIPYGRGRKYIQQSDVI